MFTSRKLIAAFVLSAPVFFGFSAGQQLKPTEIVYSRMPTDPNQPPAGTNQPAIWAVGQDGSNDRFITYGTKPRISDDGRYLVFLRFTRNLNLYNPMFGYGDFFVRELATGQETLIRSLNFDNNNSGFALSPESNQGNFEIIADIDCFIYKFDRAGPGSFRFPWENANYCFDEFPAVRRGGDQIVAFSNTVTTPDFGGLYTFNSSGLLRQKIPNTTCRDFHPSWSNDNQYIAIGTVFQNCSNSFPDLSVYPYWISNLVKIKPDGSGRQALTNFPTNPDCSLSSANCMTLGYVWTEDNSKVIAAGRIGGVKGLFSIDANGSGAFSQIPISPGNPPEFVGGIVQPRVEQSVMSTGGGVSTSANYSLVSTIGEAVAGITSTGGQYSFESGFWAGGSAAAGRAPIYDFDGDGKSDISIYRPSNGQWWLNRTTAGLIVFTFGNATDTIVPADLTGDGKTDVAIWRGGEWFVLRSEDYTFYSFPFGTSGDIPVPGDYDGDDRADAAVFRPSTSTWYVQRSSGGTTIEGFGAAGDRPVPADYDGDGKTDIAIYRPGLGQWWLNRSSAGVIVYTFGSSSDRNVPGDYTGDGKADVAIWRPTTGEWFILRSEDASFYSFPFGVSTDVSVPGDYDGDGKFDAGVFRTSDGTWYLNRSTAGTLILGFGLGNDLPVPSAFVR